MCGTVLHLTSPAGLQLQVAFPQFLRGLQLLHLGLQGGLCTHQLSPLSLHRGSAVMESLATRIELWNHLTHIQIYRQVLTLLHTRFYVEMTEDELANNIHRAINFLVSLLKKNWQNVHALHVRALWGKPTSSSVSVLKMPICIGQLWFCFDLLYMGGMEEEEEGRHLVVPILRHERVCM